MPAAAPLLGWAKASVDASDRAAARADVNAAPLVPVKEADRIMDGMRGEIPGVTAPAIYPSCAVAAKSGRQSFS
jgi:hypothetical protein